MLKKNILSNFFCGFLCLFLFGQCEKSEQNNVSKPLVAIETVAGYAVSHHYEVKYENGRIIQVGNSSYSYDTQGRVDKEIVTITPGSPYYTTGAENTKVIFQYKWDSNGRLASVEHVETIGFLLPTPLYTFPITSKKYTYVGNSHVPDKIEIFNKDEKWVETTKFYHRGEVLDSVVVQQLRAQALRWIPQDDYDFWNGGNSQYPNPYDHLRDYIDENANGLAYYVQNTIYRTPKTRQPNLLKQVFKSLGFVPRNLDLQWQNDILLPYVIEKYGQLDMMFRGNLSLVDSLAPYYMDVNMGIQYVTDSQGALEYIKFPHTARWGINMGTMEYRFVY